MSDLSALACSLVIALVALIIGYRFYLFTALADFEHDHTNPRDVCIDLNSYLHLEIIAEIIVAVFSLFTFSRSTFIFVLYLGVLGWTQYRYRNEVFKYEPLSIVRDMNRHKIECIVRGCVSLLALIAAIVNLILCAF